MSSFRHHLLYLILIIPVSIAGNVMIFGLAALKWLMMNGGINEPYSFKKALAYSNRTLDPLFDSLMEDDL